jgi:hypothetical protein
MPFFPQKSWESGLYQALKKCCLKDDEERRLKDIGTHGEHPHFRKCESLAFLDVRCQGADEADFGPNCQGR